MTTTAGENAALVALLRLGRRPWQTYAALVEEAGSAQTVLERELSAPEPPGSEPQTTLLPQDPGASLARAASDIARWDAARIRLVTVLDLAYPDNLRAVHDRPPIIFIAGKLQRSDSRAIAVIGSRQASPRGLNSAREVAVHLVRSGFTVVSGLAAGIDTAAHTATLQAGGRTLAVVGTGLARCYPPQNAALQRELAERCAVLSQFWPEAPPSRQSFPQRNATMSGVSLATVIIEASERSGARIQARRALAHGRSVFLLRPALSEAWARALSRRPGVRVVDAPEEITTAVDGLIDRDLIG